MNKNKTLAIALAALFTSSIATAEVEVSGKLIIEQASFQNYDESTIGNVGTGMALGSGANGPSSASADCIPSKMFNADGTPNMSNPYCGTFTTATPINGGDNFKSEVGFRLYIDGDITDNSTFHVELQGQSAQSTDYSGSSSFTQRDPIREIYTDISGGDFEVRLGKQQIVWGTADGMKLLDIVNPTDYAEMAQNQMEDARVPVWALNLEKGNFQAVVSQPKENVFAGLNRGTDTSVRRNNMFLDDTTLNNGTDTGNPFMMMGPDTITGAKDGFLNITPDIGSVASRFAMAFTPTSVTGGGSSYNGQLATLGNLDAAMMQGFTVNGFEAMTMSAMSGALVQQGPDTTLSNIPAGFAGAIYNTWDGLVGMMGSAANVQAALGLATADAYSLTGAHMLAFGFAPLYDSNLADVDASEDASNHDTAFDYMGDTTFRTFNSFANAGSQYVYNMPKGDQADFAIKTSQTTKSGTNYSLNFSNSFDKNPVINLSWRGDSNQKLETYDMFCPAISCGVDTITIGLADPGADGVLNIDPNQMAGGALDATGDDIAYGGAAAQAASNAAYGAAIAAGASANDAMGAGYMASLTRAGILQFEQSVVKTKNLGASFDTSFESPILGPVVVRGEALYTLDGKSPVIDKARLAVGDLVGALSMETADRFKFVLGMDITALTNMMISAQFIQDSNLDFVDNGTEYTTDYATMHMSNGFNKAIEDKNFYSLFFSKPFGESGQHRWNNITMMEEGGADGQAYWNRFDVDWGLSDDVQGTLELNNYWGNNNTQFGQLKNSSNMQVGVKYSF